jgi:hypothetical protein
MWLIEGEIIGQAVNARQAVSGRDRVGDKRKEVELIEQGNERVAAVKE